jgi:dihydrofolate reductase
VKTQYFTASSLDGFIADRHNSLAWLLQFGEVEGMEDVYPRFLDEVGALAMGSTTYEWVAEHLAEQATDGPPAWPYEQPAWVFSSRELTPIPGADIRFVRGDVSLVHTEMAEVAAGRNIWVVGGGELAGQFHDHGLLDELIISFAPVTLGAGAPLLPRTIATPPMRLVDVEGFGETFAVLTYALR